MSSTTPPHVVPPSGDMPNRPLDEALQTLYTAHVDAKAGFDVMVDKAETDFLPVAKRFRDLHERQAGQIAMMAGGTLRDTDGSFMSTVNKTVVSLRAFFDEIDDDVMDQVRSGEEHVLGASEEAQKLADGEDRDTLARMNAELKDLLDDTRHLD